MSSLSIHSNHPLTITEQIAETLRAGLHEGRWAGTMPGKSVLARELRVSPMTVSRSLSMLEFEGLITSGGPGACRRILMEKSAGPKKLRVTILLYAAEDAEIGYIVELKHQLIGAGYDVDIARQTLMTLKMDVTKVADFAAKTQTDAWVVICGSRAVAKWFSEQPTPAFALFGAVMGVPIAATGPDYRPVIRKVVRQLTELGHSRIVMIGIPYRIPVERGALVDAFFEELEAGGIATGPYNYPKWSGSAAGLPLCLDALCLHTPPTALILESSELFHPVKALLAQKGLHVPRDVSLFTLEHSPSFEMYDPAVSCTRWDHDGGVKKVIHWVNGLAHGVNPRRLNLLKPKIITGGTMGPARRKPLSPGPTTVDARFERNA